MQLKNPKVYFLFYISKISLCFLFSSEEQVIAKSTIVLDVKPWDDETDLEAMEKSVRSIQADGLIWGPCKSTITIYYY